MHANHLILNRPRTDGSSPSRETPVTIRPLYNIRCTRGSGTIVIVDAFDYPRAEGYVGKPNVRRTESFWSGRYLEADLISAGLPGRVGLRQPQISC